MSISQEKDAQTCLLGRIKEFLSSENIGAKELSTSIGMPFRTVQGYLLDERKISLQFVYALCAQTSISQAWLLSGIGDMYSQQDLKEESASYCNESQYASIPHYNVQAAAGTGVLNHTEEQLKPLAFRTDWLRERHLTVSELAVVDVSGDSMEPYLKDKDLVLVDRSQTDIASGKTYVLRLDGHLLVKNLQLLPHGLVQVASYNVGFPAYPVDLSDESIDMSIIGRVVASMHEW